MDKLQRMALLTLVDDAPDGTGMQWRGYSHPRQRNSAYGSTAAASMMPIAIG